jgi:hypothetical protein
MSVTGWLLWPRDFPFAVRRTQTSYARTDDNVMVIQSLSPFTGVVDMCLGFMEENASANDTVRHFAADTPSLKKGPYLMQERFKDIAIWFWSSHRDEGPPLWFSGQSFWLQIQRSRVRFQALPDFLRSKGSGTGSTQPREDNYGATWMKK